MTTILRAVVGSTAYGLAREGSDVDRLGVFVAPTVEVAGLDWHPRRESRVRTQPDITEHEIGKYLRLALACNPTILELLFLPAGAYEVELWWGTRLRRGRSNFLSDRAVRAAYGGYARQQAHRLECRDDGSFSSNTRQRTVKHARHLLRLLRQGRQLLETGDLIVRVPDPEDYFAFDDMTQEQMLDVYRREDALFQQARSVLPAESNRRWAVEHLAETRAALPGLTRSQLW